MDKFVVYNGNKCCKRHNRTVSKGHPAATNTTLLNSADFFPFEVQMDILKLCRQRAEKDSEQDQAYARHDNDSGNSRAKRIHKNDNRQDQQKYSATGQHTASLNAECVEIAGESKQYETIVKHPETKHYRKKGEGYSRIYAKEYSQKEVKDAPDYDIASHHQIVSAGRCRNKLCCTDDEHDHTCEDAHGHIALKRKDEYSDTGCNAQHTGNKHKPPVLDNTGSFLCKSFKSTFHGTDNLISTMKDNYCAKEILSITIGLPPSDQNPMI